MIRLEKLPEPSHQLLSTLTKLAESGSFPIPNSSGDNLLSWAMIQICHTISVS
ncbi:hypothetical protein AVDCRST_MAG81-1999 [uncultured Synechococcales cyanobacterium]|uniref:Uncharacterized protein n=1 Tax=uncultured Synechococcales cyanobacterium TaxID=1936017 RepID=A0A6J4VHJ2_9CYAN|nr:hypothetical protein AVDCRST_MAG81-1999 [uncultured Synechococcales cyanobacterium]